MRAVRFRVTGQVQGVFFRAGTQQLARRTGVSGWVRNVRDGSVQGRAQGQPDAVAAFVEGLPRASRQGRVDGVQIEPVAPFEADGFDVASTVDAPTDDWPG